MLDASFAAVFEVQGATTMMSVIFIGPIGSASSMVVMTFLPQISSRRAMFSTFVRNVLKSPQRAPT